MANRWYALEVEDVLARLAVDPEIGLTEREAERRLVERGPNELVDRGGKSAVRILWQQTSSVMVWILVVASIASLALGDVKDAVAIVVIVILNVLLGYRQEYRAEKAMAALKTLAVPTVRVRREGRLREVNAFSLVTGDIVALEAGNLVPADGRVLSAYSLRVQESALTGESEAVGKHASPVGEPGNDELALGDRKSMVYMGTVVAYGRGEAVVTATGMNTELGSVAGLMQAVISEPTPLQKRLDQLGKGLALAALVLVAVIFATGVARGQDLQLMFMTAISMAVAAVPEGLPAVVTIALALGAQRMLKRNTLIRRLPAVETLGSVTVICSDKTGTLTANKMTVTVLDVADKTVSLDIDSMDGDLPSSAEQSSPASRALDLMLIGATLCNDAVLLGGGETSTSDFVVLGDPTEAALVEAAARYGLRKDELEKSFPRLAEVPFDSVKKRMSTEHAVPARSAIPERVARAVFGATREERPYLPGSVTFTKGAVDVLLDVSTSVLADGEVVALDEAWRDRILTGNETLARKGMRVLGLAFGFAESGLTFVGLIGMIDPARPEAREAVATCAAAGIRPMMITGDHPVTAAYVAEQLGISTTAGVLTGLDLTRMSAEALSDRVGKVSVYARVAPEHKLAIVGALQDQGHVVAMTGDGVNDAPALKKADIGVAMGEVGTDVAKEAADMVLLDDNFATIVAAVEEGRVIYDNIRKFIKYILTSNSGELTVMLVSPFLGLPLALLPLQILWINLVTDGLPALALSLEPGERDVMKRPPRPSTESILGRGLGVYVLTVGMLIAFVSLGAGYYYWNAGDASWQTMVFTTLTLSQMTLALAMRSEKDLIFRVGFLSNKALLGSVLLTFCLQLAVIYVPVLQGLFKTVALHPMDLLVAVVLSTAVFWTVEAQKFISTRVRPQTA